MKISKQKLIQALEKEKVIEELEIPRLFQSDPTPNEFGGYSSVPFYCSLCSMNEMDIQDRSLGENIYHCQCSVWTSPTGGKWVKWFDEAKANKLWKLQPSEGNIYNNAIDKAISIVNSMNDEKEKYYRVELDDSCKVYVDGKLLELKKGEVLWWWVKSEESPHDEIIVNSMKGEE